MSRAEFLPLALFAAACSGARTSPPQSPPPQSVATARVQSVTVRAEFDAGGTVRAKNTAAVASRILAPVVEVRVRAGARVSAGEPLIVLDARELQAQASRAAAGLAAAKESVRAVDADRNGAEATVRLASASFDRVHTMYSKGVAAGSELDEATAALDTARARLTAVSARGAEAAAALSAAEEASKAAAIAASYAVMTSPFSGLITERLIDPGAMAAPGVPLLRVEDTSLYRLEVSVDEARARAVAVGQAVRAKIDGVSEKAIEGRVSEIASLDPSRHSFAVKIDLPAAASMRSGLFGRARLSAGTEHVVTAPASAVVRRGQMTLVFVVDERSAARLRLVTIGRTWEDRVEILAGLDSGDTVVDTPPATLTDGAPVTSGAGP